MPGILAAAPSTSAGIITAIASTTTAFALMLTAVLGVVPQMRALRKRQEETLEAVAVVHTLVNSTLTAALESDLDATDQALRSMTELARVQREAGRDPAPETVAAIGAARVKSAHLPQQLADRLDTARLLLADAKAAAGGANPRT